MAQPPNYSALKDALEVFNECIKNGNEIQNLCEKCTNTTVKSHPIFKKLIDKIKEDTKAIERLMKKIEALKNSTDKNNYQKWKSDLGEVIGSMESASHDTISKVSHALASSGAKRIKNKFEENERIFSDTDFTSIKDEDARNFAKILAETNQRIINCLKYAHSKLPQLFKLSDADTPKISHKKRRKLLIIGEDLSRSAPIHRNYEHLGEVTIKSQSPLNVSKSKSQATEFRQNLNGYLIDDSEKTEVMLKLIEPSMNLMEFSQTVNNLETTKLSATIEINGEIDEDVEVMEINIINDKSVKGSEAVAVVENSQTGSLSHVPIQIVSMSPEKEVHGKIIEIQASPEESEPTQKQPITSIFNSTAMEDSPLWVFNYATPPRKNVDKPYKSQYYTPVRSKPGRALNLSLIDRLNESRREQPAVIEQIVEDVADKVVDAIINDSNLADVSEIEYADVSNSYQPNISARSTPGRSFRGRQDSNLEDVSEIDYANLSSLTEPNVSIRRTPGTGMRSIREEKLVDISGIGYIDLSKIGDPNASIRSTPRQQIRSFREDNLADVSEIDYANLSSLNEPNVSIRRTPGTGMKSLREEKLVDISGIGYIDLSNIDDPNASVRSTPGKMRSFREDNLADVSEIDYANLSSINDSIRSSPRQQMRSFRAAQESNLEDVSEIDYANLSSLNEPNQSIKRLETTIESVRMSPKNQTPPRRALAQIRRQQPAEGTLIEIDMETPPRQQRPTVQFDDGNLMQFDQSPRSSPQTPTQNRKNETVRELMKTLNEILDEDVSSRLSRREKVHDRSLPNRKAKSANKAMNMSMPSKMPKTSKRIVFERPVQVVPSRTPEEYPVPLTSIAVHRPREAQSPLKQSEIQRVDEMLRQVQNPFQNEMLQVPVPMASQSFHGNQMDLSYGGRNISLPLHLTPQKEALQPMDRSLETEWREMQHVNQLAMSLAEDLQNVSEPFSASMDKDMAEYDSGEDLENISSPFSNTFNEIVDDYNESLGRPLPVQAANDFVARFNDEENLEDVSFELEDDEIELFRNRNH